MIGRIIGPYEVVASIGRGGMGEVFKARDRKLGRDVALKILPPELAKDPDRLARFQREARVLASLQHQNIAAIYGLEETDGQPVLAMELAAGEDLSTRLLRGPLPDNEIEKITSQLARGLEYAHEQGIVHRDLKPANVKVSGEGTVKILDFGLARAFTADSVSEGDAESHSYQPTITQALTGSGTVLGTAAYMSPEQARGYEVDRRSDIWAFGVILYEMMTGVRLFEGETATDTLAAVLHKEPDWETLASEHPPILLHICRRCLEKDQKQRLRDIGEARVALDGSSSSIVGLSAASLNLSEPAAPRQSSRWPWLVAAVAVLLLGGSVAAGMMGLLGPQSEPRPLVRSTILLPESTSLSLAPVGPGLPKVSPDGNYVAYAAVDSLGLPELYVRHLGEGWTRRMKNTTGAGYLFWSYDSREVGFFSAAGKIMRVPLNGGPAVPVVKAGNAKGASWNQFGEIIYAPTHMSPIMMVPAAGGEPVAVTHIEQEPDIRSHRLPQWLPDGRHFVYTAVAKNSAGSDLACRIRVTEAATGQTVDLLRAQTNGEVVSGHLLYPNDGVLMARPLDLDALVFTGPAFPILQDVMSIQAPHVSGFSASAAGVLVYVGGSEAFDVGPLVRYTAAGRKVGPVSDPVRAMGFDVAPDGSRICVGLIDGQSGTLDLWQVELARQLNTRLTFNPESEWFANYAPDGKWLAVMADFSGHGGIYRVPAGGGGELTPLLVNNDDNYPGGFAPDGSQLYYTAADSLGQFFIGHLDLASGESVRLHPTVSYAESAPDISPDGRWLAYTSEETGRPEVFVEGVDRAHGRWRVSNNGGSYPKWSPQGDRIYFVEQGNLLKVVDVTRQESGLVFGAVRPLIDRLQTNFTASYDVDRSTGDLIVLPAVDNGATARINLVTGWQRLLTSAGKE